MGKYQDRYSIRCLKAVEAYVGGRKQLSKLCGLKSHATIAVWVWRGSVPAKYAAKLVELSDDRFSTDDFLGIHDD